MERGGREATERGRWNGGGGTEGGDGTEGDDGTEVVGGGRDVQWREGAHMGEMGGMAVIDGRDGVLRVLLSVGVLRAFK